MIIQNSCYSEELFVAIKNFVESIFSVNLFLFPFPQLKELLFKRVLGSHILTKQVVCL